MSGYRTKDAKTFKWPINPVPKVWFPENILENILNEKTRQKTWASLLYHSRMLVVFRTNIPKMAKFEKLFKLSELDRLSPHRQKLFTKRPGLNHRKIKKSEPFFCKKNCGALWVLSFTTTRKDGKNKICENGWRFNFFCPKTRRKILWLLTAGKTVRDNRQNLPLL